MKLVLFDIDGTLMTTGAAGADAMRDVFAELCGIPDGFAGIEMSGKTDTAILREALTHHQLDQAAVPVDVFHERSYHPSPPDPAGSASPTAPHARDSCFLPDTLAWAA